MGSGVGEQRLQGKEELKEVVERKKLLMSKHHVRVRELVLGVSVTNVRVCASLKIVGT